MEGQQTTPFPPTHCTSPRRAPNIIKGWAESAFGESQPVKYVVGDTGGERGAKVILYLKSLPLLALAGGSLDCKMHRSLVHFYPFDFSEPQVLRAAPWVLIQNFLVDFLIFFFFCYFTLVFFSVACLRGEPHRGLFPKPFCVH